MCWNFLLLHTDIPSPHISYFWLKVTAWLSNNGFRNLFSQSQREVFRLSLFLEKLTSRYILKQKKSKFWASTMSVIENVSMYCRHSVDISLRCFFVPVTGGKKNGTAFLSAGMSFHGWFRVATRLNVLRWPTCDDTFVDLSRTVIFVEAQRSDSLIEGGIYLSFYDAMRW